MSATITLLDVDGNVLLHEEIEPAETGHDDGRCSMWCQHCYIEACGAPEQPDWSRQLGGTTDGETNG